MRDPLQNSCAVKARFSLYIQRPVLFSEIDLLAFLFRPPHTLKSQCRPNSIFITPPPTPKKKKKDGKYNFTDNLHGINIVIRVNYFVKVLKDKNIQHFSKLQDKVYVFF